MDILFDTNRLAKIFNTETLLVTTYGPLRARLIKRRMMELRAATTLSDMHPNKLRQARCHELKHNRAGQITVDLDQPYRLVFEPANDPLSRLPDGGLDWSQVTAIRILGVEDTHE